MVKMVDLKDIAGVGSIFIIYDQGGIHRHSLTAAVHAVQEHHVRLFVYIGVNQLHLFRLQSADLQLMYNLCQSEGSVNQYKMSSLSENPPCCVRDICEAA